MDQFLANLNVASIIEIMYVISLTYLGLISLISSIEGLSHIPDCGVSSLIQSAWKAKAFSMWFIHWQTEASTAVAFRLLTRVRNPVYIVTHTHIHTSIDKQKFNKTVPTFTVCDACWLFLFCFVGIFKKILDANHQVISWLKEYKAFFWLLNIVQVKFIIANTTETKRLHMQITCSTEKNVIKIGRNRSDSKNWIIKFQN